MFTSDLVRRLVLPVSIDFMAVSRYDQHPPTEEVKVLKDVQHDLKGKEVLLIEDIVDTGLTLNYLIGTLTGRGAASFEDLHTIGPARFAPGRHSHPIRRLQHEP